MSAKDYNSRFDGSTGGKGWRHICDYWYSNVVKKERYIKPDGTKVFLWKNRQKVTDTNWELGTGGKYIPMYNQYALRGAKPDIVIFITEG